mmetsp:Transcript_28798/g.81238  ORF Transcript_28798/g.81238 Transcript_28798/m.81238 type:complete len:315 (+) Transcript_28798:404-1348(+)
MRRRPVVQLAVQLWELRYEDFGRMLNDGDDAKEEVVVDGLGFLTFLDGGEGFVDLERFKIGPVHLQSLFRDHGHALLADLEGIGGHVPVGTTSYTDHAERSLLHTLRCLQLEFRRKLDFGRRQEHALLVVAAGFVTQNPPHLLHAAHFGNLVDGLFQRIVQQGESLHRLFVDLLRRFVNGFHDGLLFARILVFLESTVQESHHVSGKCKTLCVRLKIPDGGSVQRHLRTHGLLLALDLERVLGVQCHEFVERPSHLHVAQRHLALSESSIVFGGYRVRRWDHLDASVLVDDAFHVRGGGGGCYFRCGSGCGWCR